MMTGLNYNVRSQSAQRGGLLLLLQEAEGQPTLLFLRYAPNKKKRRPKNTTSSGPENARRVEVNARHDLTSAFGKSRSSNEMRLTPH